MIICPIGRKECPSHCPEHDKATRENFLKNYLNLDQQGLDSKHHKSSHGTWTETKSILYAKCLNPDSD